MGRKDWTRTRNSTSEVIFKSKGSNTFIKIIDAKKFFPTTGRGWAVSLVRAPTNSRGTQAEALGNAPTRKAALAIAEDYMSRRAR